MLVYQRVYSITWIIIPLNPIRSHETPLIPLLVVVFLQYISNISPKCGSLPDLAASTLNINQNIVELLSWGFKKETPEAHPATIDN
jgi:hypothetical protein